VDEKVTEGEQSGDDQLMSREAWQTDQNCLAISIARLLLDRAS
jgi:hypothetical protein